MLLYVYTAGAQFVRLIAPVTMLETTPVVVPAIKPASFTGLPAVSVNVIIPPARCVILIEPLTST